MSCYISTGIAAEMLGRSKRDILRMLTDERNYYFPGAYRKPGGHWKIPMKAVEDFLERRVRAAQAVHRRQARQEDAGDD